MVSNAECREAYGSTITDHMICAAEDEGGKGKKYRFIIYFVSCLFIFFQVIYFFTFYIKIPVKVIRVAHLYVMMVKEMP